MVQVAAHSRAWVDEGLQGQLTRRLKRAVVWSLALHLGVFILVTWVRLPQHGERPLASIEISLASLPTPPVKTAEPVKAVDPVKTPVKQVETPVPAPPVKAAPVAPPVVQREVVAPPKAAQNPMRDLLKGIELPPDAPKFGDYSPADKPKKVQEPAVANAPKLKLPDVPVVSEAKVVTKKPAEAKPRQSLTDELNRELDEELNKIKKLELPKESKTAHAESQPTPAPQPEAKAPSVKAVDTTLKVPGMTPGSNVYLAQVRRKISSMWSAPPVDVTAQVYSVVVKFRLHRDGSVSGVAVEQSSGNEYFDLAGKRAVVTANPLPMFPADLTESYFDAHFTFSVGEQNG
ncbi:MAG: cell envelope integrity protein TolA [Nitrospira sp.]|nr:cell envelope integrity protein TolA [Nitrospira sp.]